MEYLAWPAVGLILGLVFLVMFRRNIGGRIDKIQKVERMGLSLGTEQTQSVPENKSSQFQEVMDLVSSEMLRQQEGIIRESIKNRGITSEQEINKVLTRVLAAATLSLRWEQIDRILFGSQLGALVAINANPLGLPIQQIKGFYDTAVQQFPPTYRNYTFAQWLAFLEEQKLIVKGGNGYQITIDGKEFMAWLVHAGRTQQRPN